MVISIRKGVAGQGGKNYAILVKMETDAGFEVGIVRGKREADSTLDRGEEKTAVVRKGLSALGRTRNCGRQGGSRAGKDFAKAGGKPCGDFEREEGSVTREGSSVAV